MEQSDLIVVNKCDGDLVPAARRMKAEYTSALKYMRPRHPGWKSRVAMASAKTGEGISQVWDMMGQFRQEVGLDRLERRRAEQRKKWMWSYVNHRLISVRNNFSLRTIVHTKYSVYLLNELLSCTFPALFPPPLDQGPLVVLGGRRHALPGQSGESGR